MSRSIKSMSNAISSSTIQKYQGALLAAIEWYDQLDDEKKNPIFSSEIGTLETLKVMVTKGEVIRDRLVERLVEVTRKYFNHVEREYLDLVTKLAPAQKETMKNRVAELEEFLEEVE
jgi:hypothetical protein